MKVLLKPLDEQVVVVTGASSGIGLATARLAAARGARVVAVARSRNALTRLVNEIRESGGQAVAVVADVSSDTDVTRVADVAIDTFGGFDTWVNNAAVSVYGRCLEVSMRDMHRVMDTNFWGTLYGARAACAHLRLRGGALINVASVLSDRGAPLQGIYSASKHAIKGWADALRAELIHEQAPVSVTLIKPAAIGTPYAEHAMNYMPDQPEHVPPVYSARSVAHAILYAAVHPVREVMVGSSAKVLSLLNGVSPALTDRLMARFVLKGMHSGRPRSGRPGLYVPTEDLRERGDYHGIVRPSLYTALVTHPRLRNVLGAGALLMLAALWRTTGPPPHDVASPHPERRAG